MISFVCRESIYFQKWPLIKCNWIWICIGISILKHTLFCKSRGTQWGSKCVWSISEISFSSALGKHWLHVQLKLRYQALSFLIFIFKLNQTFYVHSGIWRKNWSLFKEFDLWVYTFSMIYLMKSKVCQRLHCKFRCWRKRPFSFLLSTIGFSKIADLLKISRSKSSGHINELTMTRSFCFLWILRWL